MVRIRNKQKKKLSKYFYRLTCRRTRNRRSENSRTRQWPVNNIPINDDRRTNDDFLSVKIISVE